MIKYSEEDSLVLYFVVNATLNMSIGKTGSQIAHATHSIVKKYYELVMNNKNNDFVNRMKLWQDKKTGCAKIILAANSINEWEQVKQSHDHICIHDAGLTEVQPNSETVIAITPMLKSERSKILKRLKCLQ
jgi:peptidyl-tRNA hydrolase, PTH2 family